jgi:divalent metal cation (Fe/Co/Zn/Cd) transporter
MELPNKEFAEFVTSGVEGSLIIFAGIMIIVEAVDSLLHGNTLKKLDYGILIVLATAIINYLMGYFSIKKGERENSVVLISSGKHLQSDTWTTLGVVISLVLVYFTKIYWIDTFDIRSKSSLSLAIEASFPA